MIEVVVKVFGDVNEIGRNVFFMQEIRFLHFVNPIGWIFSIVVKIDNFLHVPTLNTHIFDPFVDVRIVLTF